MILIIISTKIKGIQELKSIERGWIGKALDYLIKVAVTIGGIQKTNSYVTQR